MLVKWISRCKRVPLPTAYCVGWAILCFTLLATITNADSTPQTLEGIRLPLQKHPNGRSRVLLTAGRARIAGVAGEVEGGIRLFILSETGETNGVARSERGVFDMSEGANTADCLGPVSFEMEGVRLSGTHLHWSADSTIFRIETNAVLELDRAGKSMVEGAEL